MKGELKKLILEGQIKETRDTFKKSKVLFEDLTEEKKKALINFRKIIMIDTISHMLGIIDGSSTLSGSDVEAKLFLNDKYTDMELQDLFLEYVEELESNNIL